MLLFLSVLMIEMLRNIDFGFLDIISGMVSVPSEFVADICSGTTESYYAVDSILFA